MEHLTELSRLPEKEIKEKLDRNNYVGPGSLVLYDNKLYKVLARVKKSVFIDTPNGSSNSFLHTHIDDLSPLSYQSYRELITKKYTDGSIFKSADSLCNYFRKVLYKVYGEDRIEVKMSDGYPTVKVYFPKIVVRNSLDLEHTMTDVYLIIYFKYDKYTSQTRWFFNQLWRETYTPEEVHANYMFSHVNAIPGDLTGSWCHGHSEFATYLNKCTLVFNPKDIVFFIEQVKAYMQWESIEGTPYKYIANIKPYVVKEKDIQIPPDQITLLYNKVCENLDSFSYEIDSNLDDFSIFINSSQFKDIVDQYVPDELKTRNVNGKSGEIKLIDKDNTTLRRENIFYFKDERLIPRIIQSDANFDMNKLDEIYPKETPTIITDGVTGMLQGKFREFLIKHKLEND